MKRTRGLPIAVCLLFLYASCPTRAQEPLDVKPPAKPRVRPAGTAADDSSNEPASSSGPAKKKAGSKNRRKAAVTERRTTVIEADHPAEKSAPEPTIQPVSMEQETSPPARPASPRDIEQATALDRTAALEAEVLELRARVDSLTALQPASPVPERDEPSTVQGSPFGPDAPTQTAPEPSTVPGGNSTVQGSVFASDAGPASSWVYDGLTFTSKDGEFKTHLGGAVHLDFVGFANDMPGITSVPGGAGTQESVAFRRLRIRADGTMYKYIDWVVEFDLAFALQNTDQLSPAAAATGLRSFPTGVGVQGGNTINVIQPTTIFLTFKEIPILGNIRVGNQQNWFSLEHIESARFLDFMERSPNMDAFSGANNNGYAPGISAFNTTPDQRAGAQIGAYKNNMYDSGVSYNIGDAWIYGGRMIWSPYYDEESKGRYMVHTGFGSEYRTFNNAVSATTDFDNVRVRSRGDLRNAASTLDPNYADTGNFYAISQTLINPELAMVWGPWLFQSEYTASWFNGARPAKNVNTSLGSVFMEGGYVEALYFLTGENRTYNRLQGVFNRVIPNNNLDRRKGTWGAWQAGVRYDWLDLNSGALVNGGNASDITFGLNWFLNANARFQFNYVLSWVNNAPSATFPGTLGALNGSRFVGDGTINSFGARMDFNY